MGLIQKSIVKAVPVAELMAGDRLLVDLTGYKDRTLMNQGKVLNNRDIAWLREKLKEPRPRLASERYQTKKKAGATIRDKAGNVLVKIGAAVTDEALAPLLKEGFTKLDGMDSGVTVYAREQKWPDDRPWRVDQFNPAVKVETVVTINDDIQDRPEDRTVAAPAGKKAVAHPVAR